MSRLQSASDREGRSAPAGLPPNAPPLDKSRRTVPGSYAIPEMAVGTVPIEGDDYARQARRPGHRGNQGIGLQIAKDLVGHTASHRAVGSRNLARGETAANEVGPDAHALHLDVTRSGFHHRRGGARSQGTLAVSTCSSKNAANLHTNKLPGQVRPRIRGQRPAEQRLPR